MTVTRGTTSQAEACFRVLYDAHFDAILAYALRRVPAREDAADLVSETFLIAWRRSDQIPPGDQARLWLYGVARRVLANHLRGQDRRHRLGDRLRDLLAHAQMLPDVAQDVTGPAAVREALAHLPELDRELLELTAWEQLHPREIAVLLGLTPQVVRTRLSRARTRLRAELAREGLDSGDEPAPPGHVQGIRTDRTSLIPEEGR